MSLQTAFVRILPDANIALAQTIIGKAEFRQLDAESSILISLSISGLAPDSLHGWHIHNKALEQGPVDCTKAGTHFNPRNSTHGSPRNAPTKRHVGDLGNFRTNDNGSAKLRITDDLITLFGSESVNNLSLVVHEKVDDLGLGTSNTSLTTGNTGLRLACGNIQMQYSIAGYPTETHFTFAPTETGSILSGAVNNVPIVFLLPLLLI